MIFKFALTLMGAFATHSLSPAENATGRFPFHSIPVMMDASGKFMLTQASAGGEPLHLLIDSGAHLEISVSKEWAKAHGLEMKKLGDSVGIAGKNETFTTTLSDIEIGEAFKFPELTAYVIDLPGKIRFEPNADGTPQVEEGLLGGTFLMKSNSIVSYLDKRMQAPGPKVPAGAYLRAAQAKGSIIAPLVKTSTGAPYVEVQLGGKNWLFLVDTAAGSNIILPEVAEELGLKALDLEQKVTGVGGETTGTKVTFAENFEIAGKLVLPKMDLLIMPCPKLPGLPEGKRFAGIIGNPLLSQLQAEIDFGTYHLIFPASIVRKAESHTEVPEGLLEE